MGVFRAKAGDFSASQALDSFRQKKEMVAKPCIIPGCLHITRVKKEFDAISSRNIRIVRLQNRLIDFNVDMNPLFIPPHMNRRKMRFSA